MWWSRVGRYAGDCQHTSQAIASGRKWWSERVSESFFTSSDTDQHRIHARDARRSIPGI